MRRVLITALLLLAWASAAPAFHEDGRLRIGILAMRGQLAPEDADLASLVGRNLRAELRRKGFDAFVTDRTMENARPEDADYYVELMPSSGTGDYPIGDVEIGSRNVAGGVTVVLSRVAAEVRLYDGRTLEQVASYDLRQTKVMPVPSWISVGGRNFYTVLGLPFVQYAQYRRAAGAVARDAAARIAGDARR
ncbi:MAG TPA: hypothetical protein VGR02_16875 [Thermoanaerobaculia bacterium]|jgi:hypothetical protein|nr:hypothetical protein [Thermoanaerobaculia bacterium]